MSFSPAETSSTSFKVAAYVFISVGALTMLMGFLGCLGAVKEVRCLLGMVSAVPPALPTQRPHLILPGGPWPSLGGGIQGEGGVVGTLLTLCLLCTPSTLPSSC